MSKIKGVFFEEQENKENKFSSEIKLFENYDFDSHVKRRAFAFCIYAHSIKNQIRKYSGLPYHTHPYAVAKILENVEMKSDEVICAALLHDVVEDTYFTLSFIEKLFGSRVAQLVEMLTDVSKPEDGNRKVRKNIDLEHTALADYEGKSIKLADLIHNSGSMMELEGFGYKWMKEKRNLLEVLDTGNKTLYEKAVTINKNYFNRKNTKKGDKDGTLS